MAKHYNITSAPIYVESWEREFRQRWSEEANAKNDRIVGEGYAERQIADTLSKVEPIDVKVSKIGHNMDALIKRGNAVDVLADYFPENRDKWREHFADILNRVPDEKQKRGKWVRDSEANLRAPGLVRYYCTNCFCYNDTRSNYCPNCGASMRAKK